MQTTDERRAAFNEKLGALLSEYADVTGPRQCVTHGETFELCEDECPTIVEDGFMLTEWVLVANWVSFEKGDAFINLFTPKNQLASHTVGLIEMGKVELLGGI